MAFPPIIDDFIANLIDKSDSINTKSPEIPRIFWDSGVPFRRFGAGRFSPK